MPADIPISIIIPTKNREAVLWDTLDALQNQQPYPAELLEVNLVNDGDPFEQDLAAAFSRLNIRVFKNPGSGAASAKNFGIQQASHDMLLFLDDDMLLRGNHIRQHLEVHEKHRNVLVGGHWENSPKLIDILSKTPFGRYKLLMDYHILTGVEVNPIEGDLYGTNSVAGFNLSLPKALMLKIGCFNENFPFTGHEDREFSIRAIQQGYQLIYHTKALLYHNEFDRVDMQAWMNRKGRGNIGLLLLAERDPELKETLGYKQHLPIKGSDGPTMILRKLLLKLLASSPILGLMNLKVKVIEAILPFDKLLFMFYKALYLAHSQRGFEQGMQLLQKVMAEQGTGTALKATLNKSAS